jgi:hypothetical protein
MEARSLFRCGSDTAPSHRSVAAHIAPDNRLIGIQTVGRRLLARTIGRSTITKRQFDVVMAWSVDRLGRSLQDLIGFLSELHAFPEAICRPHTVTQKVPRG